MLLFKIKNNTVIAESNPTPQGGAIPQFYQSQGGWVKGYVETQAIREFEYFTEQPQYKKKAGKWYRYYAALELGLVEAKAQKQKEIKENFRDDILWTDEELQFYQKRKGINDDSYSQWWSAVSTYHNESYTEKQRAQKAVEAAESLASLAS